VIDRRRADENRVERLREARRRVADMRGLVVEGRLTRLVGLTLEAVGCIAPIGSRCRVVSSGAPEISAEVVGFSEERLFLMPRGDIHGLRPHSRVVPTGATAEVEVGESLLGRVLDGEGRVLDGGASLRDTRRVPIGSPVINPLKRRPIREPLDVGIRAINGLLTVGRGQRLGLFAGSGVGKSVLLGMMTRFTEAQVIVVGLIGERGREVQEFIEGNLGPEGLARSVVVAAPADAPPLQRLYGGILATRIAEHFRSEGKDVLLLMDSLTRYAQAQREIALAIGEPPATKGYPPSVFTRIPQLIERAGTAEGAGSITAFYSVLMEGDDDADPVADAARAILDGHIVLSRELAERGHYPAIDVEASISRVMPEICQGEELQHARRFKHLYSVYEQNRDLINVGAYVPGKDGEVDRACAIRPRLSQFLGQGIHEQVSLAQAHRELAEVIGSEQTTNA